VLEYYILAVVIVVLIVNIFLVFILGRIAKLVMGFLGTGEDGGPALDGLPNVDFEKVLANLMMQGGSQLLTEVKSQKGGLLGQIKELLSPKDKKAATDQLDQLAGLKPGEVLIEKEHPAQNPITQMLEGESK